MHILSIIVMFLQKHVPPHLWRFLKRLFTICFIKYKINGKYEIESEMKIREIRNIIWQTKISMDRRGIGLVRRRTLKFGVLFLQNKFI